MDRKTRKGFHAMTSQRPRTTAPALWLALAAFTLVAPAASAQNLLTATPSTLSLTCSTVTGPGAAATVVVRPVTNLTGSNTIVVTFGSVGAGLVVTAPNVTTLSTANQAAGLSYTVRVANGCAGAATAARTFRFSAGANADVLVTANLTVTVGANSSLTPTPTAVNLVCTRTPGSPNPTYTPGPAVLMAVRSATVGGTPFTVDNSTSPPPAWLTVTPMSGGTATNTAVTLSFSAAAGCGSFAAGSVNTATIRLLSAPAPDRLVQVTLQVVPPSPLTATPASGILSYTKASGVPGRLDILLGSAASPAPFMTVDTSSLPTWATVDTLTGTVPRSVRFTTTAAADSMVPGTYTTTVKIRVSNYADLSIPLTLQLNNPPPKLTVSDGLTRNLSWTVGTILPAPSITVVSSDSPISYTIETGGALAPVIAPANLKGLAYNFGTIIPVTFNPNIFAAAQPGSTLTGTVAITWGNPSATVTVTFNVAIQAPGAAMSSISPASLPTAAPGQSFTLAITGSAFVANPNLAFRTRVGVVTNAGLVIDPSIAVNVINESNMVLTITVPAGTNANLPFSPTGTGGTVVLGVCNPSGTTCTVPTSTITFTIGSNPIVDAVTSAASFQQVTSPTVQTVAPYDVLSVFGSNFCSSGGRGCASSDVLYGAPDPVTFAYPQWVTPDVAGPTQRRLAVTFQTRATPPVVIAPANVLFATNNQINILVPAALSTYVGSSVDMVVSFGYGTGATMLSSATYQLSVVAANPGLFTVAANGRGDGAILATNYTLVNSSNEAALRSTASDSDTVQIYMTGLGIPNSTADNASAGSGFTWSSDCITLASYLTSLNTAAGTSITSADGLVLRSSLVNTNRLLPCFVSGSGVQPTVTIGGVAGTVTYAGFVADSFVGLYQVNVRLPSSTGAYTTVEGASLSAVSTPVQLPVVVTSGGRSSQDGVGIWVRRKLKVVAPSGGGLTGAVGIAWASSNNSVVATQGTSPYRYAVTSGLLPAGLTMNTATGAITGTPAANTSGSYQLTVTATDSANFPITGTVSFTLTVAGGLVVSSSGTAPYSGVYGTADSSLTTITATGGTFPYTYTLTGPSPLPSGLSIDPATGVISISSTIAAGRYQVTVTATDSSSPALTGTVNFDIVVALLVSNTTPVAGANGAGSNITTVSATGGTGAITYTLDTASAALSRLSINASTGVVSVNSSAPASTTRSVTVTATAASNATGAVAAGTGTVTFTLTIS